MNVQLDSAATPLAQEMAAQIQVGLFGTVGQLAKQLRAVDRIAPALRQAGVVRPVAVDRNVRRRAAGFAASYQSIPAFGGLLYAVGVVKHDLTVEASTIMNAGQDSRIDVGDMTHLEVDRRLQWKTYDLMYDLLQATFDSPTGLPDLVILDVPLLFGREIYALGFEDEELKGEVEKLRDRAEAFWEANRPRCFPFEENGPKIVSLRPGRPGTLLRHLHDPKKGRASSPDPLASELDELLAKNWRTILSASLQRVIESILTPETRTAAYSSADSMDPRAFPKSLITEGMLGFHYLAGLRGRPMQVETLGSADRWKSEGLDDLTSSLIALTYFDHRSAMPLPLWYAEEAAATIKKKHHGKGWLDAYKNMVRQAMSEEHVERTWLVGWGEE